MQLFGFAFTIFQEKMTPKKLHEENDQVYKITILKGNYTKYNDHFDGIGKMRNEYSKFKNNFSENFWEYTEITEFPKIGGLKSLLKTNSNIFITWLFPMLNTWWT